MSSAPAIAHAPYADWKAPSSDGELLIWPEPRKLIDHARANHKSLARVDSAKLLGSSLSEIRAAARAWIGHSNADQLLIATGHQTELYHPGVWVKNAVIHAAAEASGGAAYHIAVDTDTPKHLLLRWPGASMLVSDDPRTAGAAWSGLLDAPTPSHIAELRSALQKDATQWDFEPLVFDVLDALQKQSVEQPPLSAAICNALHALDWSLGLRHHAMTFSPIASSPPFLQFVSHVLANARVFAHQYNAALREYREENGMKTNSRPMPDLFISEQSVELPFWLDDLAHGTRTRPSMFEVGGKTVLELVDGQEFAIDPTEDGASAARRLSQFLAATQHRLSPRALTLTMFLRLFVADTFIHGIGGGRYDQVLDKLIASHFNIAPPAFAVATATMLFPTAVGRERVCLPCVMEEGHRLKHDALGDRKKSFLENIRQQPRRSTQRAMAYREMQTALRESWRTNPAIVEWERRLEQTRADEQSEAVAFDREVFYAMQPKARLAEMIERIGQSFA